MSNRGRHKQNKEKTWLTKIFDKSIINNLLKNQEAQGNPRNIKIFEDDFQVCKRYGGFNWDDTKEGWNYWHELYNTYLSKKNQIFI